MKNIQKYILFFVAMLIVSCNDNAEPQVKIIKPSKAELIRYADSIADFSKKETSNLDEMQLIAEDNDSNYVFAHSYSLKDNLLLFAEQIGNDSIFGEYYYYLDSSQSLRLCQSFGKSMNDGSQLINQKVYFYDNSMIENIDSLHHKATDNSKAILARFNYLLKLYVENKGLANK